MVGDEEILFRNARFVDPSVGPEPLGDALLARAGRIVRVGRESQLQAEAADAVRRIDLGGRTAIPGLVDAHVHLESLGASMERCDLSGTRTPREAVERLAAFAAAHRDVEWVRGRGYNLNAWDDPAYPTARQLDEAVSDRPCVAVAFDGHSAWANSAALAAAGLTSRTTDPDGGAVLRDARGRPTGYLLEAATGIVYDAIPPETPGDLDRQLRAAIDEMARRGHTAAHALLAGGERPMAVVQRIRRLFPADTCPLRIRCFGAFDALDEIASAWRSDRDERVRLTGIKCFIDGSLGSRTAWMFEPYAGSPEHRGMRLMDPKELRRRIEAANRAGIGLICHAIGDRACAEVLQAFCDAGDPAVGNRVEHAQFLRPEELELFARAGVAASVQPGHVWTDWQPTERLMGSRRARWAFPLRSLLGAGAVVAMGSDAPVVPPALQASLHAAVTRTDGDGRPRGGWHAEEGITPRQWAAASHGAWRSVGEGDRLGRLAPGMACDLTVLSEDFLRPGCSDLLGWAADATVVAGRLAFCNWHPRETEGQVGPQTARP